MSIKERMKNLIADELGVDYEELSDNASFTDDLGADSLHLVELVRSVEEEFNIDIPDADAEKIRTVQDAVDYLEAGTVKTEAAPAMAEATPAAAGGDPPDTTVYKVVVNHEEQYSIWPADREPAPGWTPTNKQGTKADCLAYIAEVRTDMRPLSARKKMEAGD